MAAVDEDEHPIKQRLRAKEVVLEKASRKFIHFAKPGPSQTKDESLRLYHSLIGELEKYELEVNKAQTISESHRAEIGNYQSLFAERNRDIEKVKHDIETLKKDLEAAKLHRKHQEEYEALAKMINTFPTRQATEAEIAELNKEIEALEEEGRALDSKFDLRVKQFQLFLYSVHELQSELYDEEQEEKERLLKKAQEEAQRAEEAAKHDVAMNEPEVVVFEAAEDQEEREERQKTRKERSATEEDVPAADADNKEAAETAVAAAASAATDGKKSGDDEIEEGAVEHMET